MMKKLIVSAAAMVMALTANAQYMEPFRNVGVGVEAGLGGFGIQVSVPVVKDHLVLDVGYNFYGFKIGADIDIDKEKANEGLADLNERIRKDEIENPDRHYTSFNYLQDDITVGAKAKLGSNFKIMAEYYPSASSSFHITAGLMMGSSSLVTLSGVADDATQAIFKVAKADQELLRQYGEIGPEEDLIFQNARFSIDDKTYCLGDDVSAKATVKVNSVKPYLGIGFGRAIPKGRVGFQTEIGAWYHGKPSITSPNEIEYDPYAEGIDGVGKIMSKIQFWPQITFRLTGRIL